MLHQPLQLCTYKYLQCRVTDYFGSLAIIEQHQVFYYLYIHLYKYQKQILSPKLLNSQSMLWKSNFLLGMFKGYGQKVKFTMQLKIVFDCVQNVLAFECIPKNELDFQNIDWEFRNLGQQCSSAHTSAWILKRQFDSQHQVSRKRLEKHVIFHSNKEQNIFESVVRSVRLAG